METDSDVDMAHSLTGSDTLVSTPIETQPLPEDNVNAAGSEEDELTPDGGFSIPTRDVDTLHHPPVFLTDMRQRLFAVPEPLELKEDEFNLYWPYVDNTWVRQHIRQHKADLSRGGKRSTDYYACRLQRPTHSGRNANQARVDGQPLRKRPSREGGTCQARIKVVIYEVGCRKVTVTRLGDDHTHDLDSIDSIKRNSVVTDIARAEVMKGFTPPSVFAYMVQDAKNLAIIGGRHLKCSDVRNASYAWRQTFTGDLGVHPGQKAGHENVSATESSSTVSSNSPLRTSNLSGSLSQSPALILPLPSDTLYFPPSSSSFLKPYLPLKDGHTISDSLPHVTLTYAASLDSHISIAPATSTAISGPATKAMTHYLRSQHDAILIGVGTALADDPTLNCRIAGAGGYGGLGWNMHPQPVIMDPYARWRLDEEGGGGAKRVLKAMKEGKGKAPWVIVAPGRVVEESRVDALTAVGGRYLGLQDVDGGMTLRWEAIFQALAREGIRSVMVEGGGVVINELLRPENAELVHSVIITVAPTYLGVGGVGVFPDRRVDNGGRLVPAVRFTDVRWQPLGEDVVMCGRLSSKREDNESVGEARMTRVENENGSGSVT